MTPPPMMAANRGSAPEGPIPQCRPLRATGPAPLRRPVCFNEPHTNETNTRENEGRPHASTRSCVRTTPRHAGPRGWAPPHLTGPWRHKGGSSPSPSPSPCAHTGQILVQRGQKCGNAGSVCLDKPMLAQRARNHHSNFISSCVRGDTLRTIKIKHKAFIRYQSGTHLHSNSDELACLTLKTCSADVLPAGNIA